MGHKVYIFPILLRCFACVENFSRVSQVALNIQYERVRSAVQAPRGPLRVLERRHGLAEIVERGAVVEEERQWTSRARVGTTI